ncbi:MAG: PhzF family phenazine biosynthesis protein [Alphaproteobacteria bacterium]|nr:PhzF family phenazine biosynthesis protein [Alphaproteobacteria bacterium]
MTQFYDYVTVDVFTATRFGGNPLGVIPDARGLSTEEMQTIAREFNYSESTFVLPPSDPKNTAEVRIFTPRSELPFAGHPNVGTAYVLATLGLAEGDVFRFEEKAGLVPVRIEREGDAVVRTTLTAPKRVQLLKTFDPALVADAVSLPVEAIVTDRAVPTLATVGLPFIMTEVKDRAALAAAKPDLAAFDLLRDPDDPSGTGRSSTLLYTTEGVEDGLDVADRMFAPTHGLMEDPATGSANAALMGFLAATDPRDDVDLALRLGQGYDMGRPSQLHGTATKQGGVVTEITIGGASVIMMEGRIRVN